MVFSRLLDGDHETGDTRKHPEGASPIWVVTPQAFKSGIISRHALTINATKVLEEKRDPKRVLQNLQGSELADYIRHAEGASVMMTTEGLQMIGTE